MKSEKPHFSLLILLMLTLSIACSNETKTTDETPKTSAADLFKDDRPDFDPSAIDPAAPIVEITLQALGTSMTDMHYNPKAFTVKAGSTIKLSIKNYSTDASMPHNWVLVHDGTMEFVAKAGMEVGLDGSYVPNIKDVLIASKLLGPEESTEITFPAPPAGKYQFVCTYPGHWSLMNGEFIVE